MAEHSKRGRLEAEPRPFESRPFANGAALVDLLAELASAQKKFPAFNSAHEGYAVILEELDELWDEVRTNQATSGRDERMAKEAIQVAAMALRFVIDMQGFKN